MTSHFTSYPLFRLTLALAAGICLSDSWLAGEVSPLFQFILFCVFFSATAILYGLKCYRWRALFGIASSLCFFLLGSILLQWHRNQVRYSWRSTEAVYVGTVADIPQSAKKTVQARIEVECFRLPGTDRWKQLDKDILLYWMPDSSKRMPQCGDRICFYAQISRPSSNAEFSGFDYGDYLERQGVSGTGVAFTGRWMVLKHRPPSLSFRQQALCWREKVMEVYRSWGLDEEILAVVSALTVGDKSELTQDLKETYSAAGASHVLALSGLHVGILALILSGIFYPLRYLRGGNWLSGGLLVGILWGFAFLSGLSPSVIRAVIMYSLYTLASTLTEGRFSGFSSLSLTAFLMLLYQPMYLFDVSFQLSFAAVFSILGLLPLFERLYKPKHWVIRYIWKTLSLSMAAQIGTLPFILYYFGTFPTYFMLANLVVTPLAACILLSVLVALLFSGVFSVSVFPVVVVSELVSLLNDTMQGVTRLEGAQISAVYFTLFQAVLAACTIGVLAAYGYKRSSRKLIVALCSLNLLVGSVLYDNLHLEGERLFFTRQGIYTRHGRSITRHQSDTRIYRIGSRRMALLNDARWHDKESGRRLPLDYIYICKGFRGDMEGVLRLFAPQTVIFDELLGAEYKKRLKDECKSLGLRCIDTTGKGYYSVVLNE